MQNSNIVLWASPVYVVGTTSIMKLFIERLAYSCHLLDFAGVLGYTLTTTKNTGANVVSNYLRNIQISMGFKNLGNYTFIKDENALKPFLEKTAIDFNQNYISNFGYSDMRLENLFTNLKTYYENIEKELINSRFKSNDLNVYDLNTFELNYWKQDWIKNSRSFQEYAVNILRRHGLRP